MVLCGEPWSAKEHCDCRRGHAVRPLPMTNTRTIAGCVSFQTELKKLFSLKSSMYLRPRGCANTAVRACRANKSKQSMMCVSACGALVKLPCSPRIPGAPVRLIQPAIRRKTPRSSPITSCSRCRHVVLGSSPAAMIRMVHGQSHATTACTHQARCMSDLYY